MSPGWGQEPTGGGPGGRSGGAHQAAVLTRAVAAPRRRGPTSPAPLDSSGWRWSRCWRSSSGLAARYAQYGHGLAFGHRRLLFEGRLLTEPRCILTQESWRSTLVHTGPMSSDNIVTVARAAGPSTVGEQGQVADLAEVAELVRVDDGTDGLDAAVGDVEGEDAHEAAVGVDGEQAGVAVDLGGGTGPRRRRCGGSGRGGTGRPPRRRGGGGQGGGLAAAVCSRTMTSSASSSTRPRCRPARPRRRTAGPAPRAGAGTTRTGGGRPRRGGGPGGDLTAADLGPADQPGDLGVAVAEHLVEQEHRPLER